MSGRAGIPRVQNTRNFAILPVRSRLRCLCSEAVIQLLSNPNAKLSVGEHLASFAADAGVGFVAQITVIPICLFIPGSFCFWEPWLVVTAAMLFVAGFLRSGEPPRNPWVKAARIDIGALMLPSWWAGGWILFPILVLPTVAGVWFRRRKARI
jgi:hypothetical protein